MTLALLGPGGVGGFVAAALARAGTPVAVVARPSTAEAIAGEGIAVESVRLGDFHARPATAVAELADPVDVLLVAAKAPGLPAALDRIRTDPGLVVPLLNGLDHMTLLRERFSGRVAAGTIRIESTRAETTRIVHTSQFLRVDLAADDERLRPAVEHLAATLDAAGIPVRTAESEAKVLWGKLVRLNALACTTSAADRPLGPIRDDSAWRAALEACVAETAAVAAAEGADVRAESVMAELTEAHAELGSSMQRDIAAGREPELDHIPGAVLRAAARHGLDCPTVARLTVRIAERAGIPPPAAALAASG